MSVAITKNLCEKLAEELGRIQCVINGLDQREAAVAARETAVAEVEEQLTVRHTGQNERETKLVNRESAQSNLSRDLSLARADVVSLRAREKFLEEKIKNLQTEKGAANSALSAERKTVAEQDKVIRELRAALAAVPQTSAAAVQE